MDKNKMLVTEPQPLRAVLVGVVLDSNKYNMKEKSLDELERLADTAGIITEAKFIQTRKKIDKALYVGSGFLDDIISKMKMVSASLLIFDNELSPSQARNIAKEYKIDIADRTEVILDIFHQHAKSKEARLQVRLAELQYQLPRLKRLWTHLDRERGSAGGAGVSRGMGEKQIEVDKRLLKNEISKIKMELKKVSIQNAVKRKLRIDKLKVCLVGYTNAGKSTLFNLLTDSTVLVEDKLFATLDSTARSLDINGKHKVILSDTVGFISNIPHGLVASFRTTLKDVLDADLLLHVIDISDESSDHNISEVEKVLQEIGVVDIPIIKIFNKVDLLPEYRVKAETMQDVYPTSINISAIKEENIEGLKEKIEELLFNSIKLDLQVPFTNQKELAMIHETMEVLEKEYTDIGTLLKVIVDKKQLDLVKKYIITQD